MQTYHSHPLKRRWYDEEPSMAQTIDLLLKLPLEIQQIIADSIVLIAEGQFTSAELIQSYRSLGAERILALYKSKHKRRQYDRSASVHKLMNYFAILEERHRRFIREQILDVVRLVLDYLRTCHQLTYPPRHDDIVLLVRTFVEQGPPEAQVVLNRLRKAIQDRVRRYLSEPSTYSRSGQRSTFVDTVSDDLQIRPGRKLL